VVIGANAVWRRRAPVIVENETRRAIMTKSHRAEHVTREAILKLLSDDEITKVSTAETAAGLTVGAEYLDLEHLDQGIHRANAATKVAMGQILPRAAVHPETWAKVLVQLKL
jgi:hypothetical protein